MIEHILHNDFIGWYIVESNYLIQSSAFLEQIHILSYDCVRALVMNRKLDLL